MVCYDELHRSLTAYCAGLVEASIHNPDVQDLVSDVWARALPRWDTYGGRRGASRLTWLCTIAKRLYFNQLKSGRRKYLEVWEIPPEIRVYDRLNENEITMPDMSPALIRAFYLLGCGFERKKIAQMLGISKGAVDQRVYRLRRLLRETIQQ